MSSTTDSKLCSPNTGVNTFEYLNRVEEAKVGKVMGKMDMRKGMCTTLNTCRMGSVPTQI